VVSKFHRSLGMWLEPSIAHPSNMAPDQEKCGRGPFVSVAACNIRATAMSAPMKRPVARTERQNSSRATRVNLDITWLRDESLEDVDNRRARFAAYQELIAEQRAHGRRAGLDDRSQLR
jgi:hypothetical protein